MPAVGGFVFDSSGAPADREVRLYRRDTGALLGKTRSSGGGSDPHFDKVSLLLHMDGVDGSTTFTDSSATPKVATVNGNAKISTAQSKFGGSSAFFDGSDDDLTYASVADFGFGLGDWTWEAFVLRQNSDCALFDNRVSDLDTASLVAYVSDTGYLSWYDGSAKISTTNLIAASEWVHVAYCRKDGLLSMFVGGALTRSDPKTSDMGSARPMRIGRDVANNADFMGYLAEVRITRGVARYTANFTPPAARLPDIPGTGGTLAFGEYYFPTQHTGEVNVVCLDDASAPLENDLILRTFPV